MLNKYLWNLYLQATESKVVIFFQTNVNDPNKKDFSNRIAQLHKIFCPDITITEFEIKEQVEDAVNFIIKNSIPIDTNESNKINTIFDSFIHEIKNNVSNNKELLEDFTSDLAYYSTLLFFEFPDLFFPYYFKNNFNFLKMIAEEFGIELPPIPLRNDYLGRIKYYGTICEILRKFRIDNNLFPYELCAFMYDFAPNYLGGYKSYIQNNEEPYGAFLIGGNLKDLVFQNNPKALKDPNTITFWQCSPETRIGDSIVMYLTSPDSSINYIWKSVSKGFDDPFFYYYRCTYISNPKKVRKLSLKRIKSDRKLKNMPIVRKNMQGVNGTELQPSEYNHILDLTKSDL